VEPRWFIRSGIAASALAHLSILATIMFFAEVHPFGSVTAEPIKVDIVTPDEVPLAKEESFPDLKTRPSDAFDLAAKSADGAASAPAPAPAPAPAAQSQPAAPPQPAAKQQAAAKPEPAAKPQQQAALSTPSPDAAQSADAPPPPPSPAPRSAASADPAPGFTPPQPDLSVKYHVMLGLPPDVRVDGPKDKSGDGFDAPALRAADLESGLVTEFRRHLRTCSKLPASIAPSDKIRIKLRVMMTPDGRLANDPILIEASASMKGPVLMQSAIGALQACQPYAMLPADKYREWRVLDLSFTPQDIGGE
jgi:hypothetical protein